MDDATAAARLRAARGFVLDMDGTLVLDQHDGSGFTPIPGAAGFLHALQKRGTPFVVFTNGTGRTPARTAAGLQAAGLPVTPGQVLTPADSAVTVCRRRRHRRIMVLGKDAARRPLRAAGLQALPPVSDGAVDAVFVGWFPECRFVHIEAACNAVWDGARLYSASQSVFFATAQGRTLGTSRAITAAIHDLTGQRVEVVGKPAAVAAATAAARLGCAPGELAVIGDDPELEVPMALRAGALAVAVHTGISSAADFEALPARPHVSVPSIAEVLTLL